MIIGDKFDTKCNESKKYKVFKKGCKKCFQTGVNVYTHKNEAADQSKSPDIISILHPRTRGDRHRMLFFILVTVPSIVIVSLHDLHIDRQRNEQLSDIILHLAHNSWTIVMNIKEKTIEASLDAGLVNTTESDCHATEECTFVGYFLVFCGHRKSVGNTSHLYEFTENNV
ncbi:hypothetical protein Bpfe_006017 [Biomphalaria pfeifferi]|uniref:Uncharacterized protein n=1 Tax=Biomphalaria pfeifferi TaxID=112525 RepID=A0AAD8C263_BIOPF|nr:hypothetical protein Bpfe_006017 [Biomphalaria pfeifferi]